MSDVLVNGLYPPIFLDDAHQEEARNGKPAVASLMNFHAINMNRIAYSGHPCYTWISGGNDIDADRTLRQVYFAQNFGAHREAASVMYMVNAPGDTVSFNSGQGVSLTVGGSSTLLPVNYPGIDGGENTSDWPTEGKQIGAIETSEGLTSDPVEVQITSETDNGPLLLAGSFYQQGHGTVPYDIATGITGNADIHPKGNIVGFKSSSLESLQTFGINRDNCLRYQRPQYGWCARDNGSAIDFTTSKAAFRYIFNQAYGTGGTSFTATTPAITLPLMYSAIGRRTQVRCYVFVYAAMSGVTDTGSIGVANKNSSGTMSASASAITNTPTISGTTFAWYPTLASWNKSTSPYFDAYAGTTFDRVALCAKSSGSTDSVKIAAFTLVPMHHA